MCNFVLNSSPFLYVHPELRLALIQIKVRPSKAETIANVCQLIRDAATNHNVRVVALPESFCNPYVVAKCDEFAESIPNGETSLALLNIARELKIYVVGGSVVERDANDASRLYNTCTVWSPDGSLIAKHRKVTTATITKKSVIYSYILFW